MRKDEETYISSDEEDDAGFPRKNIDFIEISDTDHDHDQEATPKPRPTRTGLPVRIGRKEHKERIFGINTEASSELSGRIAEQADLANQPLPAVSSPQALRKGKGKARDVEITNVKKPFRGVWQDAEDSQSLLKNEAITDDENMIDVRQLGAVDPPSHPTKKTENIPPHNERATKARFKNTPVPVLQTDEDRAEWARFQTNLEHIRREIGPEKLPRPDADGDIAMGDDATDDGKLTCRDNCVYLFQIPPLMPELIIPGIKKEHPEVQSGGSTTGQAQPVKSETKIKVEEDNFSEPAVKPPPRFASGSIGKLRLRQSGRTTLDWGGTSYELTTVANQASYLQEVVCVRVVPEKDRVVQEDGGEAISMGRVKGKFIVVPDWESVLG